MKILNVLAISKQDAILPQNDYTIFSIDTIEHRYMKRFDCPGSIWWVYSSRWRREVYNGYMPIEYLWRKK